MKYVICPQCGRSISASNIQKHLHRHEVNPDSFMPPKHTVTHSGLNCIYCGKACKNNNSLRNHERLCKENPNRDIPSFVTYNSAPHTPSNQYLKAQRLGLPKPEPTKDSRQKWSAAATRNNLMRSADVNKKISDTCKARVAAGTWHVSVAKRLQILYKGIILHSTWELAYAQYLDDNNIEWLRCTDKFPYLYEGRLRHYTPDFYLVGIETYIEIKGFTRPKDEAKWEQFPKDKKLVILKEEDLLALGIKLDI